MFIYLYECSYACSYIYVNVHISIFSYICIYECWYICIFHTHVCTDRVGVRHHSVVEQAVKRCHLRRRSDFNFFITAKISNKFSLESPYISNSFTWESPKFHTRFRVSTRSPRDSKDLPANRVDLEIQIFEADLLRERIGDWLQSVAVCCSVLQCVAVCWNVLQCAPLSSSWDCWWDRRYRCIPDNMDSRLVSNRWRHPR